MQIVLKKSELVALLNESMGIDVDEGSIEINTDPFSVRIDNISFEQFMSYYKNKGATIFQEETATHTQEKPEGGRKGGMTMEDVMAENEAALNRPLGPQESLEPPEVDEAELRSGAST